MRFSATFQRYFYALQAALLALLCYSAYLVNDFYRLTHEIARLENDRFNMVALANELQQSSDQLTLFAQNYVITANPSDYEGYEQLLAIRDGKSPRPKNYHATYWNLNESERAAHHSVQERIALLDIMATMPYSDAEFALLSMAKNQSDKLSALETEAFNLINTDSKRAQSLVFGELYKEAKHNIMAPIDQFLIDLNKRLATRLNGLHQREESLDRSMPYILGLNGVLVVVILMLINLRFNRYHKKLLDLSMKDHLTRICNRKYLSEFGPAFLNYHRRHSNPVCLALMDIDHFKRINDNFGHQTGDHILQHFCKTVETRIRESDVFARYGGEEFVLIMPNMSPAQCDKFIVQLCQRIADADFIEDNLCLSYTVSIGWVDNGNHYDLETMLQRADKAMYQAKQAGRNCAVRGDGRNNKRQLSVSKLA